MDVSITTTMVVEQCKPEAGFQLLKDSGFTGVDFSFFDQMPYDDVVHARFGNVFGKPIDEVRRFYRPYFDAMKSVGLNAAQAHAPFPSCSRDEAMNRAVVDAIQKCLILCKEIDCPYLVVHPYFGDYSWRFDGETRWRQNLDFYSQLIPLSRETGVGICLENMFTEYRRRIIGATCSDMDEANLYIDRLNDVAGQNIFSFCYDTGHHTVLGQDMRESIRKLGSRLTALHIHDNDGRSDQHMAPYMGVSDWEAFLEGLSDIDYCGTLNFETVSVLRWYPLPLWPEVLRLMSETGKYFSMRLEEKRTKKTE